MENVVGKHAGILIQQEKKLIEVEKLNVMAIWCLFIGLTHIFNIVIIIII